MANMEQIKIKRQMTQKDLNQTIKDLEKEVKILDRLYFINYRYSGFSVEEASEKVGVTKRVGYIWQERWNDEGLNGLKPKYRGGKKSKLSDEDIKKLKKYLVENEITNTREVKNIIKEDFNVDFTEKHVRDILHKIKLK